MVTLAETREGVDAVNVLSPAFSHIWFLRTAFIANGSASTRFDRAMIVLATRPKDSCVHWTKSSRAHSSPLGTPISEAAEMNRDIFEFFETPSSRWSMREMTLGCHLFISLPTPYHVSLATNNTTGPTRGTRP